MSLQLEYFSVWKLKALELKKKIFYLGFRVSHQSSMTTEIVISEKFF